MTEKKYIKDDEGARVIDGRKSWGVDIPAHAYDLWMPLIGSDALGIYGLLCRLAMGGKVSRLGILKLARACRMGPNRFIKLTRLLRDVNFIKVKTPDEEHRKAGISTIYVVLDVPRIVSPEIINLYTDNKPESYVPLTWWLIVENIDDLEDAEFDDLADDDMDEGVLPNGNTGGVLPFDNTPYIQMETPVLPSGNFIDPLLDPLLDPVEDRSDFPGRKIASTESPAVEPIPRNDESESAGTEKTGSPAASGKRSTMTNVELRAEIARRQAGVAGKANPNAEERTIDMRHRKDRKPAAGDLPKIAQLVVRTLTAAGVSSSRCTLTSNQVDDLTKINVRLKTGGGEMPFTVAVLYEKYPVDFEAWAATIIATLKSQQKRLSPGNVIDLMRGYDWINVGFKAYLNARGDFSLPDGPSSGVAAEDMAAAHQDSIYTTPDRILTDEDDE